MGKVLIVGATGSMGVSLTKEFVQRGFQVTAFARNREKLEQLYGDEPAVTISAGDGYLLKDLEKAAGGADILFHCASVPYHEWKEKHPLLAGNVLEAAKSQGSRVVIIDNIYAYGRNPGHPVTEEQPKEPHTRKGKIRLQVERMVKQTHLQGTPCLTIHFPDFYGPYAGNTYLHAMLEPVVRGKRGIFVGRMDVPREYIFMPDAAKAAAELALRDSAYGQNWNVPGAGVITGHEIQGVVERVLGRKSRVMTVRSFTLFLAGLFQPFMREVREMLYLTEDPVILDGSKYEREIGRLPRTPYEQGLEQTIRFMLR